MKKQTSKKTNIIRMIIALVVIGALGAVWMMKINRDQIVKAKTTLIPNIVKKLDPSVTLKEVTNMKDESGIYVFDLKLEINGQEQKFTSYMTKDGKLFFTGGIKVADLDKKTDTKGEATGEQKKPLTCTDVKKTDAPTLTAFVVADCPYGLQMQRLMKVAATEEQGLSTYFSVKYIGSIEDGKITSMHGDNEAQENLRQICIREEQKNLYWPYVSCYMKEGKSPECLTQANVNQTQLQTCINDAQKGLAYAQKDFDSAKKLGISGSPTLVINDMVVSEFDFGGRNVDSLKQLICCGSNAKLGFCDKTLSKEDVAISYATSDKGQAVGSASASCATQ
ncbi:DsbA family protein [Patescibacteria group bacterium]|nr:DsbA family protein [Patescibacteria group bacterium]